VSRRSRIRNRERKKRQQRPKQADKPVVSTSGLIAELAQPLRAIAFAEALSETQHNKV
jgi:hypothetical protein